MLSVFAKFKSYTPRRENCSEQWCNVNVLLYLSILLSALDSLRSLIYSHTFFAMRSMAIQPAALNIIIIIEAMPDVEPSLSIEHIAFSRIVPAARTAGGFNTRRDHFGLVCWMNATGSSNWPTGFSQYVPPKSG